MDDDHRVGGRGRLAVAQVAIDPDQAALGVGPDDAVPGGLHDHGGVQHLVLVQPSCHWHVPAVELLEAAPGVGPVFARGACGQLLDQASPEVPRHHEVHDWVEDGVDDRQ